MKDFRCKSDLRINTLINMLIVSILIGRRELDSFKQYNYRPSTNFGESNVFTGTCLSTGGIPGPMSFPGLVCIPGPRSLSGGGVGMSKGVGMSRDGYVQTRGGEHPPPAIDT